MLKRNEALTDQEEWCVDYIVYYLLRSILHPIWNILGGVLVYYLTSSIKLFYFSGLVVIGHLLYNLNEEYKSRGVPVPDQKCILITGGSRGLGLQLVKNSLKYLNIDKIIILDVVEPEETLSNEVQFYHCDLNDQDETINRVKEISRTADINVFINNAGVRHDKPLMELNETEINKIFQINTLAYIMIMKLLLKSCKSLHVVTVSSILGSIAPKNLAVYSASKGAVRLLHESLSYELRDDNRFRFTLILPGLLDTTMFTDLKLKKFLSPIVSAEKLSLKIVQYIQKGSRGTYAFPLYCNFIPLMELLPFQWYEYLRRFSEMDVQIEPR